MSAETWRSVENANRKLKEMHRSVSGANRKLKEMYRSVGGANRKVFMGGYEWTIGGVYGNQGYINFRQSSNDIVICLKDTDKNKHLYCSMTCVGYVAAGAKSMVTVASLVREGQYYLDLHINGVNTNSCSYNFSNKSITSALASGANPVVLFSRSPDSASSSNNAAGTLTIHSITIDNEYL